MPYIKKQARPEFDPMIERLAKDLQDAGNSVGNLNYVISRLMCLRVFGEGLSYDVLSETHAAAADAADEFKRRIFAPYEDKKCDENGDVYGEILDHV
jgi:hypothetical protein